MTVTTRWLVRSGGVLVTTWLAFFVFATDWFCNQRAQICLRSEPVCSFSAKRPANDASSPANDLGAFWGDDPISQMFSSLGGLLGRWFDDAVTPWLQTTFVPFWNDVMSHDAGRYTLLGVFGVLYLRAAERFVADLWDYMKSRHS